MKVSPVIVLCLLSTIFIYFFIFLKLKMFPGAIYSCDDDFFCTLTTAHTSSVSGRRESTQKSFKCLSVLLLTISKQCLQHTLLPLYSLQSFM